jgi:hypothetical protein
MSEKDIMAGSMWLNEVMTGLREARFGIVCVTPENQNAPWLHFEAGAIAKEVGINYVCPYLFSLSGSQFQNNPLIHFQYKQANETGTKEIVESINQIIEKPIKQDILRETFSLWWPKLDKRLSEITEPNIEPEIKRSSDSMLEEVLGLVRQMSRSLSNFYSDEPLKTFKRLIQSLSPKEERMLHMLYGLDGGTVHTHDEVAEMWGINSIDVRNIELEAIKKLNNRYPLFSELLNDFTDFYQS